MAHYFTNDYAKSKEKLIHVKINDQDFSFYTDYNVFSKNYLDFGTRTLLESLELYEIKGHVLDLGCGYGPIGIYLAKNTNAHIDMIDINERALYLARKNSTLNKVNVNIFKSNIYENITNKYDYIITNPPIRVGKKILYDMLFQAKNYLNENGKLILVINKDQGAKSLSKDLEKEYNVKILNKNKGFYVIEAKS